MMEKILVNNEKNISFLILVQVLHRQELKRNIMSVNKPLDEENVN